MSIRSISIFKTNNHAKEQFNYQFFKTNQPNPDTKHDSLSFVSCFEQTPSHLQPLLTTNRTHKTCHHSVVKGQCFLLLRSLGQ